MPKNTVPEGYLGDGDDLLVSWDAFINNGTMLISTESFASFVENVLRDASVLTIDHLEKMSIMYQSEADASCFEEFIEQYIGQYLSDFFRGTALFDLISALVILPERMTNSINHQQMTVEGTKRIRGTELKKIDSVDYDSPLARKLGLINEVSFFAKVDMNEGSVVSFDSLCFGRYKIKRIYNQILVEFCKGVATDACTLDWYMRKKMANAAYPFRVLNSFLNCEYKPGGYGEMGKYEKVLGQAFSVCAGFNMNFPAVDDMVFGLEKNLTLHHNTVTSGTDELKLPKLLAQFLYRSNNILKPLCDEVLYKVYSLGSVPRSRIDHVLKFSSIVAFCCAPGK